MYIGATANEENKDNIMISCVSSTRKYQNSTVYISKKVRQMLQNSLEKEVCVKILERDVGFDSKRSF